MQLSTPLLFVVDAKNSGSSIAGGSAGWPCHSLENTAAGEERLKDHRLESRDKL